MRAFIACLTLLPLAWATSGQAESASAPNADCAAILEKWADDPKAVPKRVVDRCKEKLATSQAQPRVFPAPAAGGPAPVDPCTGPGAASSVLCWGPWSALMPAAEGPAIAAALPGPVEGYDPRPELAGPFEPEVLPEPEPPPPPPLPVDSCTPGAPCGFATVVDGVIVDPAEENEDAAIRGFDMSQDGSQFTVDPGGENEIASVTGMTTEFYDRDDGYENLFSYTLPGDDEQSGLGARVVRNDEQQVERGADYWVSANAATSVARSGHFAWGISTSQAGLDALNGQGVSVSFTGPMSVDNRTTGNMVLNFGTQPKWTGNWVNPGYTFSAGGPMSGVDLVSDSGQFSANVQTGSVVQGAVLGEPGNQAVAHYIDVNLTEKGRVRDVGLLRQAGD